MGRKPYSRCVAWTKISWMLCFGIVVLSVVAEAEDVIKQTSSDIEIDKYLSTFGYYPSPGRVLDQTVRNDGVDSETNLGHTQQERQRAIKRMQTFLHVPVSGQLDAGTKKIIKMARCGKKDIEERDFDIRRVKRGGRRVKRYSVNKYADGRIANWNLTELTWRITRSSRQISESQQRQIISKSLSMWAEYMPIKFTEYRGQDTPDIDIHFARKEHGPRPDPIFDGNPSDILNVLAHAWGPGPNVKGLAGDVHFDEDDNWTNYNMLLGVAVHELGHSMGLGHSMDEEAVMFPVYRDVVKLSQDDINGIREMYGPSGGLRPVNPDASRPRTQAPISRTDRPNTRYQTERPDYSFRTDRPNPGYQTNRPDQRYRTDRPDQRYRTERPDPHYRTERPDPRYRTERPDPRYRTERPDPRYRTERPDPRYRTDRPDQRYRTETDHRYQTERPDPDYKTERPNTRHRTNQPDPRIVPLSPRTTGRYYTVKPEWVTAPPLEVSPADRCASLNIDAVFEDPTTQLGSFYIAVSNENVHTLTQHGLLLKSELLKNVYPQVPINPDVAFSIAKKKTVYFIKDKVMWAYKEGQLEKGYPRSLDRLNFPERPKFSVKYSQQDSTSQLLLFGTKYYWLFDVDRLGSVSYQSISAISGQLPSGVRFAAQWFDNYLYAVTEDSYVKMNVTRRQITHEKPIAGKPYWLQSLCGHTSRASICMANLVVMVTLASILKFLFL